MGASLETKKGREMNVSTNTRPQKIQIRIENDAKTDRLVSRGQLIDIVSELIGIRNRSASYEIAANIVSIASAEGDFINLSEQQLMSVRGIGPVRARRLDAGLRLARYFQTSPTHRQRHDDSSR